MRQTENLGLALYDTTDKMNITGAENSLNHNMELIDEEFAKTMKTPETGETGQVLTKTETGFEWQNSQTGGASESTGGSDLSNYYDGFLTNNDFLGNFVPSDNNYGRVNLLSGNYGPANFTLNSIIMSNGTVGIANNYYACITSELIPITPNKMYAILTSDGCGNYKEGQLNSTNDGYGLFASDGTTVVAKTYFNTIGDRIVLFKAPENAQYVRFCLRTSTASSAATDDERLAKAEIAIERFNTWIMISDVDENITEADFVLDKKEDGVITGIKRFDNSVLIIQDEYSRKKVDALGITQTHHGKDNILTSPYDPTEYLKTSIILSNGAIRTDESKDYNYMLTPINKIDGNKTYAVLTSNGKSTVNGGLCVTNDGYGLFASDGTTVVAKTYCNWVGSRIFIFKAPENAQYVRFCLYCPNNTDENIAIATSKFDEWYMIETDTEDLTEDDFRPDQFEISGNVSFGKKIRVGHELLEDKDAILPLYGKIIVNLGDSIFGNSRPPHDISTIITKMTGATVHNCAFGGCRMGPHEGHWDAFSMYRLADSIASGDWSVQDDAIQYDDRTSYAEEPLETLKSIDWNKVYAITIGYCANDFSGNNPLDNSENAKDTTTFGGAARYSIERILSAYPQIKIYLLSSTWRLYLDSDNAYVEDTDTKTNNLGLKTGDYNNKLKEIADEYHLKYVNNYDLGINKINYSQYILDGAHHNENGIDLIARHTVHELY